MQFSGHQGQEGGNDPGGPGAVQAQADRPPPAEGIGAHAQGGFGWLRPLLTDQYYESFYVLVLNHANRLLHHACISTGWHYLHHRRSAGGFPEQR